MGGEVLRQEGLGVRLPARRDVRRQRAAAGAIGGHDGGWAEGEAVVGPPIAAEEGRCNAGAAGGREARGEGGEVEVVEEAEVGADVEDEGVLGGAREPEGGDTAEAMELAGKVED